MKRVNKNLFKTIAKCSQEQLRITMVKYLRKYYKNIISTKDYIIAEGSIPIGVVAHMDTVFNECPSQFFYDSKEDVMWSPQGLGADDRAGVYAIIEIIKSGLRPTIILTTDEEQGCVGAFQMIEDYPECPVKNINFLIELDRRNDDDAVYYDCTNEEFENFINSFGFVTANGIFSDISVICPEWGMAGVNFSVGYFNEHSPIEYLHLSALKDTINKTSNILRAETKFYKYESDYLQYPWMYNYYRMGKSIKCKHCKKTVSMFESIPLGDFNLCPECFAEHCDSCIKCSNAFYNPAHKETLCPACRKKH